MTENAISILTKCGIALAIIIGGYIIIRVILSITRKSLRKSRLDDALHVFILNCFKVSLWVIVFVTTLGSLGIPTSTFIAVLGAAGIAIALALKDSLSNFAGGIIILLTNPFRKEDYIDNQGIAGKVEYIDLLYTTLKTFDNKVITIPNGILANSAVINYSKELTRRVDLIFSISYNDDIQKAKDILRSVAESNRIIFLEPEPIIGVAEYRDSSIDLDFKVWGKTEDYWTIKYFLNEKVKLAFDEAEIIIPFHQMDVHIK